MSGIALRIQEGAFVTASERIKGLNGAIAEIADEQPVAERSKVTGSHRNAPRSIEVCSMPKAQKQVAEAIKNIDVSQPWSMRFVFGTGRAVGKGDDNVATHVLDPEGSIVIRKLGIHKAALLARRVKLESYTSTRPLAKFVT